MPHGFRKTGLFGGALVCDLPDNFADVRCVRSVIQQGSVPPPRRGCGALRWTV